MNEVREYLIINFENMIKNNFSLNNNTASNMPDNSLSTSSLVEKSNINISMITKSVQFLWETGFYKEVFQDYFVSNSVAYYKNIGDNYISMLSIENYIKFVETTFDNENYLINTYLNEFSLKKILSELESNLLIFKKQLILEKFFSFSDKKSLNFRSLDNNKLNTVINTNVISLNPINSSENNKNTDNISCEELYLRINQIEFLKKLFILFRRIKIEDEIRNTWVGYINMLCNKIYSQYSNNYLSFFQNILELKKNIDAVVKDSFNSDDKMKAAGKDGFVKSINMKPNFIADYFARYIDHILTESGRDKQYILDKIEEFMLIFRHLDAKDMFEGFHIKRLSYRLLYSLTNYKEGEAFLIEKLKNECGAVFVTKSEEMIQDIENSIESTLNFHAKNPTSSVEYNFYVLSSNSWPLNTKAYEGFISNRICELQKNYSDFYNSKNSRKVLKWHLPFCTAELCYKKIRNFILEVNGVQCAILYLFNRKDNYIDLNNNPNVVTLKKILDVTFLDKDLVLNALKHLTKNVPILIKVQENGGIFLHIFF